MSALPALNISIALLLTVLTGCSERPSPVVTYAIATGEDFSRNSLDNVLRVHHVVPTEWVMIETSISMVARGTFHGSSRLFAEDGTLLATKRTQMPVVPDGAKQSTLNINAIHGGEPVQEEGYSTDLFAEAACNGQVKPLLCFSW